MLLKYRVMKKLEFDEPVCVKTLASALRTPFNKRFTEAVDFLGRNGFLAHDSGGKISLYCLSSFREYKAYMRKTFFEISVSISAITVAITSVLQCL